MPAVSRPRPRSVTANSIPFDPAQGSPVVTRVAPATGAAAAGAAAGAAATGVAAGVELVELAAVAAATVKHSAPSTVPVVLSEEPA